MSVLWLIIPGKWNEHDKVVPTLIDFDYHIFFILFMP